MNLILTGANTVLIFFPLKMFIGLEISSSLNNVKFKPSVIILYGAIAYNFGCLSIDYNWNGLNTQTI